MRYSLFAGGKRIRPILVLAAGEAVGGRPGDLMPLACAVEMIHTYSLIHDDLPAMDDDDLRRGKPTSHKVFGEAIAILAGDALLTRAFALMAETPADADLAWMRRRLEATAILGEACGTTGLIGGQVEDLESEGRTRSPPRRSSAFIAPRPAPCSGPACAGARSSGEPRAEQRECLGRYASAIGLAFQVVDDILDTTEGAAQLGKTAGKDAAAQKATYVSVHGLAGAQSLAARLLVEAEEAIAPFGARGDELLGIARLIVERRS